MKTLLSPKKLQYLLPGCGIAGALLRLLIDATAMDEKGLLITGHPAVIALWLLTAAAAAALLLGTRTIQGPEGYRDSFPGSISAAVGCALAAITAARGVTAHFNAGPAVTDAPTPMATVTFYLIGVVMALAAAAFVLSALGRLNEKRIHFLFHVVLCIYFALQMLQLYQTWSFDPQEFDYCFQLFACIALTMTAYQLADFGIGKGCHRKLWFWGLAAAYLCFLSSLTSPFFLTGALWAWTNLSSLRIRRERKHLDPETIDGTEG